MIEHPLNVLCNQVELEVNHVAGLGRFEIRLRFCVWNNPDHETPLGHFGDGKADSIDSD